MKNSKRRTVKEEQKKEIRSHKKMKKLPKKVVKRRIDEFLAMRRRRDTASGSVIDTASGSVLETALFLEDVFGIELDDTELNAEKLGEGADLTGVVLEKMEGP